MSPVEVNRLRGGSSRPEPGSPAIRPSVLGGRVARLMVYVAPALMVWLSVEPMREPSVLLDAWLLDYEDI